MSGLPITTAVYVALDILSLCIEGYISMKVNPLVEPVLLRGVEIVYYNLQKYIKNPHDVSIREKLCTAGLFTAIANIITGFGINFALCMGMNGKNRISKSVLSSILIPFMIDFNLSVSASRFAKIARVMGKDTSKKPETESAFLAIEAIKEFKEDLGIELHQRVRQLGLAKEHLAEAAEVAIHFEDINSVPRKASFENLMAILEKAY
jgi:alcohol dehydrogenase